MSKAIIIFSIIGILFVTGCSEWWYPITGIGLVGETAGVACGAYGYGDVDNDGFVTSVDASLILQHSAGLITLSGSPTSSGTQQDRADVNNDNRVDSIDANLILQTVGGLVSVNDFPACTGTVCSGPLDSNNICSRNCGAPDSACYGKRVGELAEGGGTCNSQCIRSCTTGCVGCGYYRNSDCSIVTNAFCINSQFCGNTVISSLSCSVGCAGCGVKRNSNCLAAPNDQCAGLTFNQYCADPPSSSCTAGCTSCNTYQKSNCITIYDSDNCWNRCTTPYKWPTTATAISQGFYSGTHNGIDIDGNTGDPIYATAPGIVIAEPNSATTCSSLGFTGSGVCVLIKHDDGRYSRYTHLNSESVSINQRVWKGDQIGTEGCTGTCSGDHLHFEIWDTSTPLPLRSTTAAYIDPCQFYSEC
jgi:hypothetical protein